MLPEKKKILLDHLRNNSRKSLVAISNETGLPISTLFNFQKDLENSVILKYSSLTDFAKAGHIIRANFAIKANDKKAVKDYLMKHKSVNNLSTLINDYDFFAECVFRDIKEHLEFKEELNKLGLEKLDENFVVEELKKEEFRVE